MASPDVSMNIPEVENMAQVFSTMSDIAKGIAKTRVLVSGSVDP